MHCLPLADDCGISTAVTDSILRCLNAGSLRGTSLLANGTCMHSAAQTLGMALYTQPELAIGVHLNLLEGRCTLPPAQVPLLADEEGWFRYGLGGLWAAATLGTAAQRNNLQKQMLAECCAQIDAVQAALHHGWQAAWAAQHPNAVPQETCPPCPPCYLDGHLHIHCLPAFRPVLGALLRTYNFRHVRVPAELRQWMHAPLGLQMVGGLRRELLGLWGRELRCFLQEQNVPFPGYFIGSFASGSMTLPLLQKCLEAITKRTPAPEALVEIMFHPYPHTVATAAPLPQAKPQPQPSLHSAIAARQARLAAAYTAPSRKQEEALLLSPQYHHVLASHDPSWQKSIRT
ncbi:carbohydrate deacetylase [Desulfovibrio cuneatus]|uniref:carbohydrate deacetylase n=1 Tax=Desulfovibrio cuneatus TaxID=159728 RepID=UPI00040B4CFC|nr:ChbG/HpnK family deacetylase [Desulfovibrio cuneatus]